MPFRLTRTFFFLLIRASLSTSYAQDQRQIPEIQESLTARKRFVSNVELLVGSGTVFFRGDEFYKETGVFKPGFSANVGLVHKFNSRVHLNSVIAYQLKGNKWIHSSVEPGYPSPGNLKHIMDITTKYATLTLFAKYSFSKGGKLFIGCGPYFGYLFREKVVSRLYLNGSLLTMSGTRLDPDSDYKRYDIGLAMTTGINLRSKRKRKANVQIIYQKGLVDINQPMITQIRNNAISILLGITVK
jgi:hypothetical protein